MFKKCSRMVKIDYEEKVFEQLFTEEIIQRIHGVENKSDEKQDDGRKKGLS